MGSFGPWSTNRASSDSGVIRSIPAGLVRTRFLRPAIYIAVPAMNRNVHILKSRSRRSNWSLMSALSGPTYTARILSPTPPTRGADWQESCFRLSARGGRGNQYIVFLLQDRVNCLLLDVSESSHPCSQIQRRTFSWSSQKAEDDWRSSDGSGKSEFEGGELIIGRCISLV